MSERIYDDEIAPVLLMVATKCKEHGMSLVATVEYEPATRGTTRVITDKSCLEMQMQYLLSMAAPNIDSFLINLIKYCNKNNIDASQSLFLQKYVNSPTNDELTNR